MFWGTTLSASTGRMLENCDACDASRCYLRCCCSISAMSSIVFVAAIHRGRAHGCRFSDVSRDQLP